MLAAYTQLWISQFYAKHVCMASSRSYNSLEIKHQSDYWRWRQQIQKCPLGCNNDGFYSIISSKPHLWCFTTHTCAYMCTHILSNVTPPTHGTPVLWVPVYYIIICRRFRICKKNYDLCKPDWCEDKLWIVSCGTCIVNNNYHRIVINYQRCPKCQVPGIKLQLATHIQVLLQWRLNDSANCLCCTKL